mmetsp:Transcript_72135/g.207116  ORF Transcript_72135/g.207116 Transcript_72135/m.207116 type:complete len:286 (-) Transcript_72135:117-974(-)
MEASACLSKDGCRKEAKKWRQHLELCHEKPVFRAAHFNTKFVTHSPQLRKDHRHKTAHAAGNFARDILGVGGQGAALLVLWQAPRHAVEQQHGGPCSAEDVRAVRCIHAHGAPTFAPAQLEGKCNQVVDDSAHLRLDVRQHVLGAASKPRSLHEQTRGGAHESRARGGLLEVVDAADLQQLAHGKLHIASVILILRVAEPGDNVGDGGGSDSTDLCVRNPGLLCGACATPAAAPRGFLVIEVAAVGGLRRARGRALRVAAAAAVGGVLGVGAALRRAGGVVKVEA